MANKKSPRVFQKNDIEANWLKAKNFIPGSGEFIVYNAEKDGDELPEGRSEKITYERFKIGNGVDNVNDLAFQCQNIYYYNSLNAAIADINNEAIGRNASNKQGAAVSVHIESENKIITILEDIEYTTTDYILKPMVLNLNGKTLSIASGSYLRTNAAEAILTVHGNKGKIVKHIAESTVNERIFFAYAGTINVFGGEYEVNVQKASITSSGTVQCRGGALINLNDCSIITEIHGTVSGTARSSITIYGAANSSLNLKNCIIVNKAYNYQSCGVTASANCSISIVNCDISSNSDSWFSVGVENYGKVRAEKTKIFGDSLAGSVDYQPRSMGVHNNENATLELIDCQVYGIHSGVSTYNGCYINGGIYEGVNHGGLYLANKENTPDAPPQELYVENAIIAGVNYRGANKAIFLGSFNPEAGLYVSDGCNLSLYLDNCTLKSVGHYLIAVSYQNNKVYMTNCSIDNSFCGWATVDELIGSNTVHKSIYGLTDDEITVISAQNGTKKFLPRPTLRLDSPLNRIVLGEGNTFKIEDLLAFQTPNSDTRYSSIMDVYEASGVKCYIRPEIQETDEGSEK